MYLGGTKEKEEEHTCRDIGSNIGEYKNHQREKCDPTSTVDASIWFHKLPQSTRYAGFVEPIHGYEHPTEEY